MAKLNSTTQIWRWRKHWREYLSGFLAPPLLLVFNFAAQAQNPPSFSAEVQTWAAQLKEPDDRTRYNASKALSNIAFELLVRKERSEVLIAMLSECVVSDKYNLVRANCAIGLFNSGSFAESAIPQMTLALGDTSPLVRAWVTRALASIGGASRVALPKILQGTTDKDNRVRRETAFAVLRIDPEKASQVVKALVPELAFTDIVNRELQDAIRDEVARSLKALTGPAAALAIKELQGFLVHPDRGVQGRAREIIAALNISP